MLCKYTYFLSTTTFRADGANENKNERNLDTNKLLTHPRRYIDVQCFFNLDRFYANAF